MLTTLLSGTTLMYGPPSAVKKLYGNIQGSKVYDSDEGLYSFPCDNAPSIAFSWGGKLWSISADEYVSPAICAA